jgi:flagellar M-ring protein FliF
MTTFMQQLNLRRALEGELMRTINQFPEVNQCRVHLNMPERRLFEDDQIGSASVVLHLQPGRKMMASQISGIGALVANSVDGIEVDNVVVMDSKGNILVEKPQESGVIGAVGNQWELQQSIEYEIQRKILALVEGIVGKQNAVVKVAADLNFDQLERTIEHVDPDNAVLLSEERYTETSADGLDSTNMNIEKITSNFELSKRVEHFIANTGDVKRLTVAVLVNGKYTSSSEDSETGQTKEYSPRSQKELDQIASLVRTAVGYSEERGDVVEVQNMQFVEEVVNEDQKYFDDMMEKERWETIITYVLLGLGLLLSFFLLRGLLKTSVVGLKLSKTQELPGGEGAQAAKLEGGKTAAVKAPEEEEELSEDLYIAKLSPEARAKLKAKDKMTEEVIKFAKESPENATKLMRSWLTREK